MIYSDFRQMSPNTGLGYSFTKDQKLTFYGMNVPLNQETF